MLRLLTGRVLLITAVITLILLWWTIETDAYEFYNHRIPNGSVFSCQNCHYPDNAFRDHFVQNNRRWSQALAVQDSDRDGWSNGAELLDPAGNWQEGQPAPGDPEDVTNPGNAGSHPPNQTATPTPTYPPMATATPTPEPPPTGTTAPSATPHLSPTPSPLPTATPPGQATRTPTTVPSATPVPPPTETPISPATGTPPPPSATATPLPTSPPESFTIDLQLNRSFYRAGDPFLLTLIMRNDAAERLLERYVILDVYGEYWFHPRWSREPDYELIALVPYQMAELSVLDFTWPFGAGSADKVRFWAGCLEPATLNLVGGIVFVEFAFGH